MTTGFIANAVSVIDFKSILVLLPVEAKAFEDAVKSTKIEESVLVKELARYLGEKTKNSFLEYLEMDVLEMQDDEEYSIDPEFCTEEDYESVFVTKAQIENVVNTYTNLVTSFEQFESQLRVSFHDSNLGSCHDEIDGTFWEIVDGISLSPQALALKKLGCNVKMKGFVTLR